MVKKGGAVRFNDIWYQTVGYFKDNFVPLSLIGLIFSFAINFIFSQTDYIAGIDAEIITAADVVPILIFFALLPIMYSLLWSSVAFLMKSKKKNAGIGDVLKGSSKYYGRAILLSLVLALSLMLLALAFVIPAIIAFIYWTFAFYVLVFEDKKVIESMKGSYGVVKGRWWNVFFMSILLFLVIVVISGVLDFIIQKLSVYLGKIFFDIGINIVGMYEELFGSVFMINYYLALKK